MAKNSHIKVRTLMADIKIGDREFFTGKVFAQHFESLARTLTKRWAGRRKITVTIDWNTNENSEVAGTDNNNIYINAGNPVFETANRKLLYKRVLGLFAHELGHILWTDFVAAQSYQNGLRNSVWFPKTPRLVNGSMVVTERDFWALASESSEHREMLINYLMQISNILEDGFIEEQLFRTYPGTLSIGLNETRDAHWEKIPELKEMIDKEVNEPSLNHHPLFTMFQVLLEYSKYGDIKYEGVDNDDEHIILLGKMIPLVDEYMQSIPRERFTITSEVALIMFPLLKDFIEKFMEEKDNQNNQQQGNGDSDNGAPGSGQNNGSNGSSGLSPELAKALSEMLSEQIGNMEGNTTQAKGSSKSCASVVPNSQSSTQASQNRSKSNSQLPVSSEFGVSSSNKSSNENEEQGNGNALGNGSEEGEDEASVQNNSGAGDSDENGLTQGDEADEGSDEGAGQSGGGDEGEDPSASSGDQNSASGEFGPSNNGAPRESGKTFDGEGGQISYGEGECSDGSGTGEVTYNEDYEAEIDANIEKKIESLLDEMRENRAVSTLEGQRTRELNKFANDISYGNAHKHISVRVNRANEVSDSMKEKYDMVSPSLIAISKNLVRKYRQIAEDARSGGRLDGLLMGRKFNAAAAFRNDGKVFMKNIMPQQMQPLAVGLLLDESGSMSGKRSEVAMSTAIILQQFCETLDIPIAIYGHSTGSYACELYSYIEFDTFTKNDKYRLTDIGARGCNRDGAALRYVAERLMQRPEEAKLLILVSDGQPNGDYGYSGAMAEADLRGIQKEYTKKGVCFCAAAIGDDKEIIESIYGNAFLDISDLNQLPQKLVKVLSKYLHTV